MLRAWILHGAENRVGISSERAGQTGLLAAWSVSGAGPEILVNWIFWEIRTVFGNLEILGG